MNIGRRNLLRWIAFGIASRSKAQYYPASDAAASDPSSVFCELNARDLTLSLSDQGNVLRLILGPHRAQRAFRARSVLSGCELAGIVQHTRLQNGAQFVKTFIHEATGSRCRVIETFISTGTSIRWTIEIIGEGNPWTTSIRTEAAYLDAMNVNIWTAWDNPPGSEVGWSDPLVPVAFSDRTYRYGGFKANVKDRAGFCIPMLSILEASQDLGLSLIHSPENVLLDLDLQTTALGDVFLTRTNHRICNERTIRFDLDLVSHAADWRPGLGWMANRYRSFFEPPNPIAFELDGCGAYSKWQGDLDVSKYAEMAFGVNWNAHFDFPYEGMFIPPVDPSQTWTSWYGETRSIADMRAYDKQMKNRGFHVLEYFCTTDAGNFIQENPPPRKAKLDKDLWKDPNDFIHYEIPDAVVRSRDGRVRFSNWFGCVNVDPGEPVWREILLQQARRIVKYLPESSGICIDRMDWLATYNPNRDDGVTWLDGRPARSLLVSWKQLLSMLGPIMHTAGKCIYGNPIDKRIDANAQLDGLYDEFADFPHILNLCGFLSIHKPAIGWTRNLDTLRPDPDALFQRHLYMGVFPTVPFPDNDHTIRPDPWADRYFRDYGPLLAAIRGKRWVLRPHVVKVEGGSAKANIFDIPGGFAVPVTFGGSQSDVTLTLSHLPMLPDQNTFAIRALHPGSLDWLDLTPQTNGPTLILRVPLVRGCAIVTLKHSWIRPETSCFDSPIEVEMGTVINGTRLHYTTDGSIPDARSARYYKPIVVTQTTIVKLAVVKDGATLGRVIWRRFINARES